MENQRIAVYPATGVENGIFDIYRYFGESFRLRFPNNFINSYHYDTKTSFRNNYLDTRVNILKNGYQTEFSQQLRPRLTVIFDNKNNDQEEAAGGAPSPFIYPLVHGIHPEKVFYIPIYKDPNNIEIYMTHKRVKVTFEIIIDTDSLNDQENVLSYCENLFKTQYGSYMENVPARYILPNDMIEIIYKLLYFENFKKINELESIEEKNKSMELIEKEFNMFLNRFSSNNGIYCKYKSNNRKEKFYINRLIYNKIYFEINSKPEKTDGEKIGSVFNKYSVTMSGFFEFVKPISYLLYTPDVICGNLTSDILSESGNIDKYRNYTPPTYMKYYGKAEPFPLLVRKFMECSGFEMIFTEFDITVDSPSDYIDLVKWLEESKKESCRIYAEIIKEYGEKAFINNFKYFMYEEDTVVEDNDLYWDGEILHIKLTDSTRLYKFYLLCNTENPIIKEKYEKIKNKLNGGKNEQ